WSRENAMGEVTSGAHVTIYRSQKDYFDGKVLFEGESDAEGKVRFNEVESGVYYIVATKGDMGNIFYETMNLPDGLFIGMVAEGIFQSQEQINAAADQKQMYGDQGLKPGNFKW